VVGFGVFAVLGFRGRGSISCGLGPGKCIRGLGFLEGVPGGVESGDWNVRAWRIGGEEGGRDASS